MSSASFGAWGAAAVVSRERGHLRFAFEKGEVRGGWPLEWFIGSGRVGRNYAYSVDGFLFQAPVSYYSVTSSFGASPGYQSRPTVEMTRPVEPACLQCHASRTQPVSGTQNRYAAEPFLEGGISCERCHGPGMAHIAAMAKNPKAMVKAIVNPAKLDASRRDSVCAQCHLTGAARVARANTAKYSPGTLLSDSVAVFIWEGPAGRTSATSHYERFAQSACRKAAGDKLWCGTCHSVHDGKTSANRACAACHATVNHPPEVTSADCAGCHMPKSGTQMGDHVAYTDHAIRRRAEGNEAAGAQTALVPFGGVRYSDRDTALGYAVAAYTEPRVRRDAFSRLAAAAAASPNDAAVLGQLAQFNDRMGREDAALDLARRAIGIDPSLSATAVNLGGYLMKRGQAGEAIELWRRAIGRNTGLIAARINLAVALFQSGDGAAAQLELRRVLELEPDHAQARAMLAELARRQ